VAKKKIENAIKDSEAFFEIAGKRLLIRKWNLRQQMKYGAEVAVIAKKVYGEGSDSMDLASLVDAGMDNLMPIVAETITNEKNGFATIDEAEKWLNSDEFGLVNFISLCSFIARQNIEGKKKEIETLCQVIPGLRTLFAKLSPVVSSISQYLK